MKTTVTVNITVQEWLVTTTCTVKINDNCTRERELRQNIGNRCASMGTRSENTRVKLGLLKINEIYTANNGKQQQRFNLPLVIRKQWKNERFPMVKHSVHWAGRLVKQHGVLEVDSDRSDRLWRILRPELLLCTQNGRRASVRRGLGWDNHV